MNNPVIAHLSAQSRQRVIVIALLFNIVIIAAMSRVGVALKPYNIVDFELAGSLDKAQCMLSVWKKNDAMPSLFFVLGFDYLFMLVYSFSLWFVSLHVADVFRSLSRFMIVLAWMQPIAAVLDAIENAALFQIALNADDAHWPLVAWWSAVPKFVIALAAVVMWLTLSAVMLYRRRSNP
jgi:hypothetical protein